MGENESGLLTNQLTIMQLKEHTISYSRKVQLDRFEPIEVYESVTVSLDPGDDLETVSETFDKVVRQNVERRILRRLLETKMAAEQADLLDDLRSKAENAVEAGEIAALKESGDGE